MHFSLLQENFAPALSHVSRFVATKAQLPILSNLLVTTESGRIKLSATNLELGVNYWLGAKIDQEGSITIPAKEITEFISYLPAGILDVSLNENNLLHIKAAKAESTFAAAPATDFPQLPPLDNDHALEFDASELITSINQVSFAAATDDTRPVLTAILWQLTATDFTMIATDGFRLSVKKSHLEKPLPLAADQTLTYLVPARSLIEVTKLAKTAKTIRAGATSDEHQFLFVLDDIELVSRLLEGDFPPYQRILPEASNTKITLDKAELDEAVKMSSVFARESANVVKWKISADKIELSSNAPQVGQNRVELEAKIAGDPLEIAFNYKFLADFLTVVKGKQITVELNQPLTPGLFRDSANPDFTHIIMPVRIQD
ncbi:DNA polymerase III subunit beta [Patescibacteria group bacterium]|nr:DNA polymerase III subunit beta [Patescibacteria group bacterium]